MKIAARDFDGFLRGPKAAAVLLYGPDAGQIRQRTAQLAASWLGADADPMAALELSAERVKEDGAILADELAAMSLMAPRRVITLREAEDAHLPAITRAMAGRAAENFLILASTEPLPASSKLRLWAERSADAAAVPFYKDEGAGLEQFIRDTLRGYGLKGGTEVIRYLAAQLSGDRQIIVNELEKLSLYMGDEAEEVSLEDAMAAVGENNDQSFDALNNALAAGDRVSLCTLSDRLLMEGNPGLMLVRSLMRYFARLELIALKRAEGQALDLVIESLRPPVFFKTKAALKAHAGRWSADHCALALAQLQMLELDSKRHADESLARLAQGFLTIAALPEMRRAA